MGEVIVFILKKRCRSYCTLEAPGEKFEVLEHIMTFRMFPFCVVRYGHLCSAQPGMFA